MDRQELEAKYREAFGEDDGSADALIDAALADMQAAARLLLDDDEDDPMAPLFEPEDRT